MVGWLFSRFYSKAVLQMSQVKGLREASAGVTLSPSAFIKGVSHC